MTTVALVAHWDWVIYNYRMPLVRALRERDVDVLIVCPRGDYTDGFEDDGAQWIGWDVDRPGVNPLAESRAIRELTHIYKQHRPDLVQHYAVKPNLYGSIAAKRADVPRVVNTFTGLGYLFSDDPHARRLRLVLVPLLRRVLRWTRGWSVVLTPEDLRVLTEARVIDDERVSVLPEGIDSQAYSPPEIPVERPVPVVFMAGRLLRDKGLGELVDAARRLHRRGIEVRFVVAGQPDEGNPASVPPAQIATWAAEGEVEFLGHRSDVPELLRAADIAVLPSYHEGLPRFLLEAAATGLAIVASDIPGCRAVVEDRRSALLVPPRDTGALAEAIEALVGDPGLRRRLGAAARAAVMDDFDEGAVVERQLEVYGGLGLRFG